MRQVIDDEIGGEAAALFKVRRKVVPSPEYLGRPPQPILDHGQKKMVDAVQSKCRSWDVESVPQQMEQGFQCVRLVTFRADHGGARQTFDQNVPDSEYTARLVHALQSGDRVHVVHQHVVRPFGDSFLHGFRVFVESDQFRVGYRWIDVLRYGRDLDPLGRVKDGAGRHTVHGSEDVATAEKILETLDAEPHPTGFDRVDLFLLVLVAAVRVPDPPHVLQQAQDAI